MLKVLRLFSAIFLSILVVASFAWLALWKTQDLHFYSVQTGSMYPALQTGDLSISIRPNLNNLRAGDIISYRSPQTQKVITHRIVQLNPKQRTVITKGDKLVYADPPVAYNLVTAKTVKIIPKAGYLFDFMHKPLGLIALVYLPGLIIAAFELQKLMAHFAYRPYRFGANL